MSDHESQGDDRTLWRAVITQALADATSTDTSAAGKRVRKEARLWFTARSRDLVEVCALADLDPETVRAYGLSAIAKTDAENQAPLPRGQAPTGRRLRSVVFKGEAVTCIQLARDHGLSLSLLVGRLDNMKLTPEQAVAMPTFRGNSRRARQWAEQHP